jgi:hypothetical protein
VMFLMATLVALHDLGVFLSACHIASKTERLTPF